MEKTYIRQPCDASKLLTKFKNRKNEIFGVIALSKDYQVINVKVLFRGSKSMCLIKKREVFTYLLRRGAVAFICFHNHPSGTCLPSTPDNITTKELYKIGGFVDVQLLDHIILTRDNYFSYLEYNLLNYEVEKSTQVAEVE